MIVDQIHFAGIAAIEPKDNSPISGDRNRPRAVKVSFQRMESQSRQVYVSWICRDFETCEDSFDLSGLSGGNSAPIAFLIKAPETLMAKMYDHM